ncbi:MAG: protoheme IX farnesyltransferase [Oceanospirillaceae bacterium]|uniref:heme o synthase n=1 Tax=unclassified Thalassolituus TaxID=2624967 RepID=UPI000C4956BE|nr:MULTISPECIES: heme o synthase [unclassified Thalassolituus]MAS26485.1 protoheme IX farnesyltransferase [Oceanospirillaceae bacterium]MAX98040.1 protoheme IX farnesyltransferase [Oceanospirillaceae bacterium]MBL34445.1 protoheme IX farnesyltransferase [Oceanospirillaceae bacterium]MBS52694.1 protoheme IX farnesyltransferase [Oceanospirillaceae bacterium]|tara:strand:+ start:691 stop:1566 length:876 start_codon:yes stop_codon:yes gene_type:complete
MKLKRYLKVTKPGIIMGNLIATAGGFFLAAQGSVNFTLLLATALGLSLVVASGCAFNNCIDRDIDGRMERTRNRVTVTGEMSLAAAFAHALVLGVAGFALLIWQTNPTAVFFAAFGFVIYVGVYSLWMKRSSVYGTLIGSLSGAVPPVVGYCAVSGSFDTGAAILLLMFCLWQMPHSYAIGIFRFDDYKAAGIPVLPVAQGINKAKLHIVLYILAFALVTVLLTATGYAGYGYLAVACVTSLWWLAMALRGWHEDVDDYGWARSVFGISIVTITALSIAMAVDFQAPTVLS